jgi:DNA-binding NarL/FixJ family response regulator
MLDLCMRGRSGLELLKLIRAERPRLPILVFSAQLEEPVRAAGDPRRRHGATSPCARMARRCWCDAARVAGGRMFLSPEVTELPRAIRSRAAASCRTTGSPIANTASSAAIVSGATLTGHRRRTVAEHQDVSTHKSHILDKMTLAGQVEMVRYSHRAQAARNGERIRGMGNFIEVRNNHAT